LAARLCDILVGISQELNEKHKTGFVIFV